MFVEAYITGHAVQQFELSTCPVICLITPPASRKERRPNEKRFQSTVLYVWHAFCPHNCRFWPRSEHFSATIEHTAASIEHLFF